MLYCYFLSELCYIINVIKKIHIIFDILFVTLKKINYEIHKHLI